MELLLDLSLKQVKLSIKKKKKSAFYFSCVRTLDHRPENVLVVLG